jgi:hypothetical protein
MRSIVNRLLSRGMLTGHGTPLHATIACYIGWIALCWQVRVRLRTAVPGASLLAVDYGTWQVATRDPASAPQLAVDSHGDPSSSILALLCYAHEVITPQVHYGFSFLSILVSVIAKVILTRKKLPLYPF